MQRIRIKCLPGSSFKLSGSHFKKNIKKINEIKKELEDLDKEKVLKIAKKKGEDIKEQAQKLVDLAVEKGTPVLEKAANEVREKAIDVTKSVLDKLEKEGK